MLLPHSKFLSVWSCVVGISVAYVAIAVPMQVAFGDHFTPEAAFSAVNSDLPMVADMLKSGF